MGGQKTTQFMWTPTKRRGPIAAEFSTPGPAAIGLQSTFGTNVTVKPRSPAFTISGRHETKSGTTSPGPGQYNVNGLSYKGKDEVQAPSMHVRPKEAKHFVTPAPGDYQPEKGWKALEPSPKFSFGLKSDVASDSSVPAPNSYNVPRLIGNGKCWGSLQTSPSFTISGRARAVPDKMKIPGPGSYDDAVLEKYKTNKGPAFSMGLRTTVPSDDTQKPGPGAHCPEKYNQNESPNWTMSPRLKDHVKDEVPGPARYETPSINLFQEKLPAFTMSHRTDIITDKTLKPAPNAYSPEKSQKSESPMWTLGSKLNDPPKDQMPGPGSYEAVNLDSLFEKLPAFSLSPRTELPKDKTQKPAANAYEPEKCDCGPKWTISSRAREPSKILFPGPGSYEIPDLNMLRRKQPIFSMSTKPEMVTDKTKKPAPNAYFPEEVVLHKSSEFSFGIKHSPYAGTLRDQ